MGGLKREQLDGQTKQSGGCEAQMTMPASIISTEIHSEIRSGLYGANYRIDTVPWGALWCTCARALACYHSPNIQTSLAEVKRLKLMDSGAIHLMGNRLTEAAEKRQEKS